MKILSIDYGQKHIGLAICDEEERIASPMPSITVKKKADIIDGINFIIDETKPGKLLFGVPSNTNSPMNKEITAVAEKIKELSGLDVIFWNEDLSSIKAEMGRSKKFKKEKSHSEAARIILQEYLDSEVH